MTTLLTLQQISVVSGIAMQTLYRMVERGELACVRTTAGPGKVRRTRGRIRVLPADWEAWVQRHRSPTKDETIEQPRPFRRRTAAPTVTLKMRGADRYAAG